MKFFLDENDTDIIFPSKYRCQTKKYVLLLYWIVFEDNLSNLIQQNWASVIIYLRDGLAQKYE